LDPVLVEYLNSGEAWLFVGSGPSNELGYPSWKELAEVAGGLTATEGNASASAACHDAIQGSDFPLAFEHASKAVGMDRLLEVLRSRNVPSRHDSHLYDAIVRWPASVYLTTNFDGELARRLAALGLAYEQYGNSPEHLSLLTSAFSGGVVRLHGDLTGNGLILTASQYDSVATGTDFIYWRQRLASIFQMQRVVVLGYSLKDPHVRAVLKAAKEGSTASNPVCWIAPDVTAPEAREYLEKFRIRVIPYPSTDDYSGLRRVVDTVSEFVIPRQGVRLRKAVASVLESGRRSEPAATAVYVFNRLAPRVDIARLRTDVALAALESALPALKGRSSFTVAEVLEGLGWPPEATDTHLLNDVARRAVKQRWAIRVGDRLRLSGDLGAVNEHRAQFEHLRNRFLTSLRLRIRRECSWVDEALAETVARDIEASLTGFFMRGGLTLASVVLASERTPRTGTVPTSVMGFISEASAQYDEMPLRIAFWRGTLGAFTDAGEAERAYLGRLAQGFFAFHALGVFGEAAIEQARTARATVWLIDSSLQIPLLALASASNAAYVDVFRRLIGAGIRMFSTSKLFEETHKHFRFAEKIIIRFGPDSHNALAAAVGDPPYWKQNLFLQGFIEWQRFQGSGSWSQYVYEVFGAHEPEVGHITTALNRLGIEVVDFQDWAGFAPDDFASRDEYEAKLKELMRRHRTPDTGREADLERWLDEKTPPEAEAAVVVVRERSGRFGIVSGVGHQSPSWFISATSVINALGDGRPITWQPEAFLAYGGTLVPSTMSASSDRAFEVILASIAQSGISPISEATIAEVFGSVIDQASIELEEQRDAMVEILGDKYGEKPGDVLRRLPPSRRLIATIQMSRELVDRQRELLDESRQGRVEVERAARKAQAELDAVDRYRKKVAERQALNERRKRQARSGVSKKRRG
jgi:Skp family chaperone for outer membrane proteins